MNNPNINVSMFDYDGLIAYRDSIASQLAELLLFKQDIVQELGHRGLLLADLNQGFTGALNSSAMRDEQALVYKAGLDARIQEMSIRLDIANSELSERWNHRSVA